VNRLSMVRRLLAALALLAALSPLRPRAATAAYGVRLPREGLIVEVPYSMGTHHEHVTAVDGTVRLDPEALRMERGRLVVRLAAFRSDDPKRGCHLREALGLDYARSRYPREHVCDDQNRLPASGPDAIAFPEIVLELSKGEPAASGVDVEGVLTVHGKSRPVRLHLAVSRDASSPGTLRVRGRVPLHLADFGVQVKPAKVLFVSITVADEITVAVDALLEPVGQPAPK
jgi:polyisoprenoid-binding protein YceI